MSTGSPLTTSRLLRVASSRSTSREQMSPGRRARRSPPWTAANTGTCSGSGGRCQPRMRAAVTCVNTASGGSTHSHASRSRRSSSPADNPSRHRTNRPCATRRKPTCLTSPRMGLSRMLTPTGCAVGGRRRVRHRLTCGEPRRTRRLATPFGPKRRRFGLDHRGLVPNRSVLSRRSGRPAARPTDRSGPRWARRARPWARRRRVRPLGAPLPASAPTGRGHRAGPPAAEGRGG